MAYATLRLDVPKRYNAASKVFSIGCSIFLAVLFGDIYRTLVAEQEIKLLLGQFSLQLGSFIPHDLTKNR